MKEYWKTQEHWKDIKGYEGLYQVSTRGRVRSFGRFKVVNGGKYYQEGRTLRLAKKSIGYMQVSLHKDGRQKLFLVHRLVGDAFIPTIEGKLQINHKDGDGTNNQVDNLEWCNPSENGLHAYRVLGRKSWTKGVMGKDHPTSKPVAQFTLDGKLLKVWDCGLDAVRQGFDSSSISRCCHGQWNSHKGYKWQFAKA